MATLKVDNGGGRVYDVVEVHGYRWIKDFMFVIAEGDLSKHLEAISSMRTREDDVFLCNDSKAGTHWVWEIVSMLVSGKAEYQENSKQARMLEVHTVEELDSLPSPRVLNSHIPIAALPRELFEKKRKIIHISRNPKDSAVSFYHMHKATIKYNGSFSDYLPMFIGEQRMFCNNWFDYELSWEKLLDERPDLPVLHIYYEDLKKNPVQGVAQIAKFLAISASEELIAEITRKCSFKNMKIAKEDAKGDVARDVSGHQSIYRKGVVGDWKNWFSAAENEQFDQMFEQRMAGSKLKFQFE